MGSSLEELNELIYQHNMDGWYVKYVYAVGDAGWTGRAKGHYALLEMEVK